MRQWLLRITAYGDRLATELDDLQWPDSIKSMQKNWIGRSEGAEVDFFVGQSSFEDWKASRAKSGFPREPGHDVLRVYTTRPDTLFGVTYMVLAPEHPAVALLTTPAQQAAVDAYRQQAATKSDLDRTDLAKGKSGVFTGGYAINPVNGERVPVWIADYVLISYGTGAIMAGPRARYARLGIRDGLSDRCATGCRARRSTDGGNPRVLRVWRRGQFRSL